MAEEEKPKFSYNLKSKLKASFKRITNIYQVLDIFNNWLELKNFGIAVVKMRRRDAPVANEKKFQILIKNQVFCVSFKIRD